MRLIEEIARELLVDTQSKRFRAGFERRIAGILASYLSERPGELEQSLRVLLALERELAGDPSAVEAARAWSSFVDRLVGIFGRAARQAGSSELSHRRTALETVDSGARIEKITPKESDVAAGPFARFLLQPKATKRRAGSRR